MTPNTTEDNIVDFDRILQRKVKKFIRAHNLHKSNGFLSMLPVCYEQSAGELYREHLKTFLIKKKIDTVWKMYKTINPREAWSGAMVSFGLQYSRSKNTITYMGDAYEGMESGQVLILNLKLMGGIFNMAVAHEITEVNEEEKSFRLCYMQGGASKGSQRIMLKETPEGYTQVIHHTYYKSQSVFRDTTLYPIFHSIAISEFHNNIASRC